MGTKDDEELEGLRDPSNWDWESAERHSPTKSPGAVISVRFKGDDASRILACAQQHGQQVTDFIRDTVLERVDGWRAIG